MDSLKTQLPRFTAPSVPSRAYSAAVPTKSDEHIQKLRNIGISAHIDSGKTTLTERILYYTGRIRDIHEVRGKDGVGAKMDSMELEREKGITIQSAATYTSWGDNHINIIDTPGHVDFTIEVERALRVLDGAILVICSVGGVQSQTTTVDRQMKRYNVPRIIFVNKCDRVGANPFGIQQQVRKKLGGDDAKRASLVQIPIGLENLLQGVVSLVDMRAYYYEGENGDVVTTSEVPAGLVEDATARREELIMQVSDADDELAEKMIEYGTAFVPDSKPGEPEPTGGISPSVLRAAIRRATLQRKFCPIFVGSAFKNKGIQQLLDGVIDYLPNPTEKKNVAYHTKTNEIIQLEPDAEKPFVGLAFKLEEGRFGQLTYLRIYQGVLERGSTLYNVNTGEKTKVPRLVRMHSNEMEEVDSVGPGEICALFGVQCSSGHTFTSSSETLLALSSMHVPDPVMSLSMKLTDKKNEMNFTKALQRFQKEDPTFRVTFDSESSETIISGMGELHLEIYAERMKREYGIPTQLGKPRVAFRETIRCGSNYEYTHKKQTGGRGQYAKMAGFIEAIDEAEPGITPSINEFDNQIVGNLIPPEFLPACEKGFNDGVLKGPLTGNPVVGVRMVVNDGAAHPVDSSEMAFRVCASTALREAIKKCNPQVLEPIMEVEVTTPAECQGVIVGSLNRRRAVIKTSETIGEVFTLVAEVPLNNMFGYSTELRSQTQGKGEFSMTYFTHRPVPRETQEELIKEYQNLQNQGNKK